MTTRFRHSLALFGLVTASLAGTGAAPAVGAGTGVGRECAPAIVALPLPPGAIRGDVLAVREDTAVGFVADAEGPQHAAQWTRADGGWVVRDLGDFGLPAGEPFGATGVDARGEVAVGVSSDIMAGWLLTHGVAHQLKDFAGGTNAYVRAINASGEMVGKALDAAGNDYAAMWQHWWSTPARLAPVTGYDGSYAQGVNDAGVVVGASYSFGPLPTRATQWSRTGAVQGVGPPNLDAEAANINDGNLVVGRGFATPTALRWDRTRVTDSGLFADAQFARAIGVNDRGDVSGFEGANLARIVRHVLYWPRSSDPLSLLPLSLDWSDGALSHVVAEDGSVYGSSAVDHVSFPRPTVWTCPRGQAFRPTPQGPPPGYQPPVVVGLRGVAS